MAWQYEGPRLPLDAASYVVSLSWYKMATPAFIIIPVF